MKETQTGQYHNEQEKISLSQRIAALRELYDPMDKVEFWQTYPPEEAYQVYSDLQKEIKSLEERLAALNAS